LKSIGIDVSSNTVCRLLKGMGFSLRVNSKKLASGVANPPDPEKRNQQFEYIGNLREQFASQGLPTISVDTKKKELVGNFKNNGSLWQKIPIAVYDHDFPTHAVGKAVPYGIYDTQKNSGTVFVGYSADTPSFAVECIEKWWKKYGKKNYPDKTKMLINVKAHFVRKLYKKGEKVSDKQLKEIRIEKHQKLSDWNYKLTPSKM
jgi:hypothetical protein